MSLDEFGGGELLKSGPSAVRGAQENEFINNDQKTGTGSKQWVIIDDGKYQSIGETVKHLPSKVFNIKINSRTDQFVFCEVDIKSDFLVRFNDSLIDNTIKEIEDFWKKDKEFKRYGFTHHRGYLLYGPAGGGKTSLLHLIMDEMLKRGGLIFICENPNTFVEAVRDFRKTEPNRNVVCIFEDIDATIRKYGDEVLLQYLDGDFNIDKVLNIATTNYPEVLDKRIVGRPRRFDRVIKVGYPDEGIRRQYFAHKLEKKEVDKWTKKTDGLSFASLAELIISVKCLGKGFEESIELLNSLQTKEVSSDDGKSAIGFEK